MSAGGVGRGPGSGTPPGTGERSGSQEVPATAAPGGSSEAPGAELLAKPLDRRRAIGTMVATVAAAAQAGAACTSLPEGSSRREELLLAWQEKLKGNFRLMTEEEKADTVARIERLAALRDGAKITVADTPAQEGVRFGYAFNISKCKGYRECVAACVRENNQDRRTGIQYIRIFEMEGGEVDFEEATAEYEHDVPAEGHFYLGTQCFQCGNPPCVEVCPVGATWQEPDGITVIDYDWCIGCRYCIAACPYWARRFNWGPPHVPAEELDPVQHYLGNRVRRQGCVEKCTFCLQRSREGRLTACVEACPTGARVFGNVLDPESELRWILEHKKVFRLKEDLGTEPHFWYFMD